MLKIPVARINYNIHCYPFIVRVLHNLKIVHELRNHQFINCTRIVNALQRSRIIKQAFNHFVLVILFLFVKQDI